MLRLIEHYVSVQGEGPRVGMPTQFVRFAGCNLKCPGWPCDTPFAIDPKIFTKEQQEREAKGDLLNDIVEKRDEACNICFTGGEPLLQPNAELIDLAESLVDNWSMHIEMFTNGSRPIPERLLDAPVGVVMDYKLSGSGDFDKRYNPIRLDNLEALAGSDYCDDHAIKFVCKNLSDLREAIKDYAYLDLDAWPGEKYFGVVWDSELTVPELVEHLIQSPVTDWKLNLQTHNYIYSPHERAR